MKKLLTVVVLVIGSVISHAQDSLTVISNPATSDIAPKRKDWSKVNLNQAGDHFMITLTTDHWAGAPDSISNRMSGLSRGLNVAFMFNKPFKTDPRWSVAFGIGISHSSMFFKKTSVDLRAAGTVLPFRSLDSSDHFKKYKLATTYAEVPIELRYAFNPENINKSWKIAIGVKVGTMLNAHTKGKTLQNKSDATINNYTEKISRRNFFNSTRLAGTARVGLGSFSLFGSYSITGLLRDGAGATIRPIQVGLTISGL